MKKILLITITFFGIAAHKLQAQESRTDTVKEHSLNEFVVSAHKSMRMRKEIAQTVQLISEADIQKTNAQSTADLLAQQGNVHVQKSQQGGGSPVLWGFEANRVLLVIDGVRMNNLIYRGGHLQNVITIDQFVLDRAEVLYGPSSVSYGSDALGGVINFYTRNPILGNKPKSLTANTSAGFRVGSANKEITGHAAVNLSLHKFGSYTAITYSRFDDLLMGKNINAAVDSNYFLRRSFIKRFGDRDSIVANNNPYLQVGSGYKQIDWLQKFVYQPSSKIKHTLNVQHSNSSNVPRYDRLTDLSSNGSLRYAEWYYGPQERWLAAYQLEANNLIDGEKWVIGLNYQNVKESRHDRALGNNTRNNRYENVQVVGLQAMMENKWGRHHLQLGADAQLNSLHSTAEKVNLVTQATSALDTRYPNGKNTMNNMGVFANEVLTLNERWNINAGLRIGYVALRASTLNDSLAGIFRLGTIAQNNVTYSANLGLNFLINQKQKWTVGIGSGYRAPNIDDLSKIFETSPGTLIIPNANLKPEQTLTAYASYTYSKQGGHFANITGYYTRLFNGIVTQRYSYLGSDSLWVNSVRYMIFSNQNLRDAFLTGFTMQGKLRILKDLHASAAAQYTYGRIMGDTLAPLDHIPPFSCRVGLSYVHQKFNADVYALYNAWKRIQDFNLAGEDNQRYALPSGMPSWYTLNVRATYIIQPFFFQAGIENLLDKQYRTAFSGINGAGRNFYLAIKYNL